MAMALPSPENELQKIETFIEKYTQILGNDIITAVKQAIQGIRDVVGDYPGLYTLIATWTQAIGPVSTAQSYLQKAQTDLPEAWTGTAAGEYKTYLTNLQTTSTNLSNCLSNGSNGIIEQLEGLGTAITKNYQDIIQFATDCADALIGLVDELQAAAAKTIVGVLGKDVGQAVDGATGITSAVLHALNKFIKAWDAWLIKVLGTNDELHKGIANINVAAQKLVVPVPGAY